MMKHFIYFSICAVIQQTSIKHLLSARYFLKAGDIVEKKKIPLFFWAIGKAIY